MLDNIELYVVDCFYAQDDLHNRVSSVAKSVLPDLIITYRCPYILPYEIFSQPRLGSYNIHPSLLPNHSGLNPWPSIMNDASKINGVTLHRISMNIDKGEQIAQKSYSIANISYECARRIADEIAAVMIRDFLKRYYKAKE